MRTGIIVFSIIILILIGGIIFYYFKYEKPQQNDVLQYVDASIFAQELNSKIFNETGYRIYSNGVLLSDGKTAKYGGVSEQIPFQREVTVVSYNLEGQDYYVNNKTFFVSENRTYRITLELISPGNLSFIQKGIFSNNEFLYVNVTAVGKNRDLYYCLIWSRHIIFADSKLDERVEKDSSLGKCYFLGDLEDDETKMFIIEYRKFGKITKEDFILMNFYDFTNKLRVSYDLNNCDETCYI